MQHRTFKQRLRKTPQTNRAGVPATPAPGTELLAYFASIFISCSIVTPTRFSPPNFVPVFIFVSTSWL